MGDARLLTVYLHEPMLRLVRGGGLGFFNRLAEALQNAGWQVEVEPSGEAARAQAHLRKGYALFHMEKPTHDRALTFRRAYHYPFWRIEAMAERWRWPVAAARFEPATIDAAEAEDFAARLRARVLPGPPPRRDGPVLIALQGRLREQRSFQTASPLRMVKAVARTGRPCVATFHPRETYDDRDRAALDRLSARFPNLTLGGDTARLLRDCAFTVSQNSAVSFDGLILGKPAVLFGQSDFPHIALNVAEMGARPALASAADHAPPYAAYLDWFLRRHALDMMVPDARARILARLSAHGWPVRRGQSSRP